MMLKICTLPAKICRKELRGSPGQNFPKECLILKEAPLRPDLAQGC